MACVNKSYIQCHANVMQEDLRNWWNATRLVESDLDGICESRIRDWRSLIGQTHISRPRPAAPGCRHDQMGISGAEAFCFIPPKDPCRYFGLQNNYGKNTVKYAVLYRILTDFTIFCTRFFRDPTHLPTLNGTHSVGEYSRDWPIERIRSGNIPGIGVAICLMM